MTDQVDLRELAENLLALGAYKSIVAAEYERQHEKLEEQYRALGIRGQDIVMPDGTVFGTVSVVKPGPKAVVSDMDACLEWVEANHPTEVVEETRYVVRPAYLKRLLDLAAKDGVGVDPDSGEVLPWIEVQTPTVSMRATATREAKEMVRTYVAEGRVPFQLES